MSKVYPCVYCTEDGHCTKYPDDKVTSLCVQHPCEDEKPSNADRIRAMTDEGLAEWMATRTSCMRCPVDLDACHNFEFSGEMSCEEILLSWLKSPVEKAT